MAGGGAFPTSYLCPTQLGYTALIYAAEAGHIEFVRLLVEGGADLEASDKVLLHHVLSVAYECKRFFAFGREGSKVV
jgi:hypothetical protein